MSTINERIKELRKSLGSDKNRMTLEKFGAAIGISAQAVSGIERGENNPSEQTIKMICREFNVREEWLRDGEGEPFLKMDDEDIIMECVGRIMSEDSTRRRVIAFLSKLPPDRWEDLERLAHEMYDAIKKED